MDGRLNSTSQVVVLPLPLVGTRRRKTRTCKVGPPAFQRSNNRDVAYAYILRLGLRDDASTLAILDGAMCVQLGKCADDEARRIILGVSE